MVISAEQFAAELLAAAARTNAAVQAVVTHGAVNVKNDWKLNVRATAPVRNAGAAEFISFDVANTGTSISAEIGYDKAHRPARLGNLLEFGGGGDHSPPHRDGGRALDAEEPRFISAMEMIGEVVIQ